MTLHEDLRQALQQHQQACAACASVPTGACIQAQWMLHDLTAEERSGDDDGLLSDPLVRMLDCGLGLLEGRHA